MFNLKLISGSIFFTTSCVLSLFLNYSTSFFINPIFSTYVQVDIFGFLLFFTTIFTLFICLFIVDNKYFFKNKWLLLLFWFFIPFIAGLVLSNNFFSFFIFYELLLIPSFILVRESSPNRRSEIVSNYFLLWTQFGSFLVLLGLFSFTLTNSGFLFLSLNAKNTTFLTQFLIFFGFGVKIPLWPFHFWLSKTHVEANTGFSIFLSGVLVKAAVFGVYKFVFIFNGAYSWFFITIVLISLIDASLKMCIQNDLKKLVALSTIQEMGFMTLLLMFPSYTNYQVLISFVVFHTFISGLFFWIVDCIYRRYNTRVIYNINGIANLFPNLTCFVILATYLFIGLPFTIKFSIEIFLLKLLFNYNFFIATFICFVVNYVSIIFFFKIFIFINFGHTPHIIGTDLTKKEVLLFLLFIAPILILNFL